MGNPTCRRGERGFTLIEVMIAATVLVVGVLSTFKLIDSANTTTSLNAARLGGQGLAREIVEYARATDYDSLQPSLLLGVLRQRPSLAGTVSPWTIHRRGVDYTVTPSVCTFDDPKDGLAATPPDNACPAAAAVNTLVDANPDDFRRVTIKLDWRVRAHSGTMTQSALIVNPAGALGPRITDFQDPSADNTQFTSGTEIRWDGIMLRALTSTTAAGVHWSADDRISGGDATGGPTSWTFTWPLGDDVPHLHPLDLDGTWVPDGSYIVQAQAVDGRGVPGEARSVVVHLNRHKPAPVAGAEGGYNGQFGGVVDLHWGAYPERDLHGYRVYRDPTATDQGTLICPADGQTYVKTTCTDANPGAPGSTHTYRIFATDCQSLVGNCVERLGDPFDLQVTLSAGTAPSPPASVTATIVEGLPKLTWPDVPGAKLYRIYRDTGTGLSDRYDETISSDPTYTDPHPGDSTSHTYWVTTVDNSFNESAPSPAVTSPGS